LSCLVLGVADPLTACIVATLAHGGARVERAADQISATELSLTLPTGPWIWIFNSENVQLGFDELRNLIHKLPNHDIRFVDIRPKFAENSPASELGIVQTGANVLTRGRLFRAVAIAAGRQRHDQQTPIRRQHKDFSILLPRAEARRNDQLILVAEDNEINQQVILHQLTLLGYAADVANTGTQALELWQRGKYTLLLTDLNMPEMDGYELALHIRAREQGLQRMPILALTANAQNDESDHYHAVGIDGRITKPVALTELKAALANWIPVAASTTEHAHERAPEERVGDMVDIKILEDYIGQDPGKIREFLSGFRTNVMKSSLELSAAYGDERLKLIRDLAHRLKSSAAYIGALTLSALCAEMEVASKTENSAALTELMPVFDTECNAVIKFLDRWLALH